MRRTGCRLFVVVATAILASCGSSSTAPPPANDGGGIPVGSKAAARKAGDSEVSFESDGVKISGSLRMPKGSGPVPAAVLIAGSGPTDRDGNSKLIPGDVGTLSFLAEQLDTAGVASLRYDKLGTGRTGLGSVKPADINFDLFVQEARDALIYLAAQPDIDTSHLMLVGHSEGGLIALVASTDPRGAPGATALALVNPLPKRYLDMIVDQLRDKVDAPTNAAARRAVDALRAGQPVPSDLPPALNSLFAPENAAFLRQADQADPVQLATVVDPSVRVLVTCADKDIQVPCAPAKVLAGAFPPNVATFVTLTGTNHVLKETSRSDGTEYAQKLTYSKDMKTALDELVTRWLG